MPTRPSLPLPNVRVIAVLTLAATALCAVPTAGPARAASEQLITVTTTRDTVDAADSIVSLREATLAASAFDGTTRIELAAGAEYRLTRCGPTVPETGDVNDLDLTGRAASQVVVIQGNGASVISVCEGARLLHAEALGRLEIRDLALAGGRGAGVGGALMVHDVGATVLDQTTVQGTDTTTTVLCTMDCTAMGAVVASGTGTLTVRDSRIVGNEARTLGCRTRCTAIGGLWTTVPTDIQRSLITGNTASVSDLCTDGCSTTGGLYAEGPALTMSRVTIARNHADTGPCATCDATAAMVTVAVSTMMTNTTIDGNVAASRSAVGGVHVLLGSARLVSTTLIGNAGLQQTGERTEDIPTDLRMATRGTVELIGTVVAGRPDRSGCGSPLGLAPRFVTSYSYDGGPGCGFAPEAGNIVAGGDPGLAPPSGPLQVRVPQPGSRVLDAIPANACPDPLDAQLVPRPQGAGCDIGAVEVVSGASAFVPLTPARVFDTRQSEAAPGPKGAVPPEGTIDVAVTGVAGVPPTGVSAVVLSVTATESEAAGFVTVWPSGGVRPLASSINLTGSSQTRSGLVTVPVGEGGRISLYSSGGAHLLADVAGYYWAVSTPVSGGRIVPLTPARVLDTRPLEAAPGPKGFVGNDPVTATIAGRGGVPSSNVAAVVLNVTATQAGAPGFVSVWPGGQARPLASVVNVNAVGDTASNLVMVPLGPDGTVSFLASGGAHLAADVMAYVTGPGVPPGIDGLFVPMAPVRLFDTRPSEPAAGPKGRVAAGGTVRTAAGGMVGVPAGASGVVVNLAATDVGGPGFVTIWSAGGGRPLASTVNVGPGDTRSNAAIVPLGEGGNLELYTLTDAHLLADVAGYFLGAA